MKGTISTKRVLLWVLILGFSIPAEGTTITVRADGTGDYPTIQAAIDAADPNDHVVLEVGTYTGDGNRDVDFKGKSITVRSTDPEDPNVVAATIIDCQGSPGDLHRGFYFHNGETSESVVAGVTIINGNAAQGSGIYSRNCSPTVAHCVFSHNTGSGIYSRGSPTVRDCIFSHNTGSGMYTHSDSPLVSNCVFTDNSADFGGGIESGDFCNLTLRNCTFTDNSAKFGGGIYIHGGTVSNCTLTKNSANEAGGGICGGDPNLRVTNCIITANSAGVAGGGICCNRRLAIANSILAGNWATTGGGMYNARGSMTIVNCTIGRNVALGHAGGICCVDMNNTTLFNSILWSNTVTYGQGAQLGLLSTMGQPCSLSLSHTDVMGGESAIYVQAGSALNWYDGNIDADPLFLDLDNPDPRQRDYHLARGSPCVDSGDNAALPPEITTDLDDNPRIVNGVVDMGAYEYQWLAVALDIKPDACPNPVNVRSRGVLGAAVLGTAELDVMTIDPNTIGLTREGVVDGEGNPVVVKPVLYDYKDVGTPYEGTEPCGCPERKGDGYLDLTLRFETSELVEKLKLAQVVRQTVVLVLRGNLLGESPGDVGRPILGRDCIRVLGPRAGDANGDGKVNMKDFAILQVNFGQSGKTWEDGDFDGDGDVDMRDYMLLSTNYGKSE